MLFIYLHTNPQRKLQGLTDKDKHKFVSRCGECLILQEEDAVPEA